MSIHSCSYYCDRPECIKAQRDELRSRLAQQCKACFGMGFVDGQGDKCLTCNGTGEQPEQEPVVVWKAWECKPEGLKPLTHEQFFRWYAGQAAHSIKGKE